MAEDEEWERRGEVAGGYELLRLAPPGTEDEVVAVLRWPGGWERLTKDFMLELKGSALTGGLGERAVLMIVITASRIFWLRQDRQTGKGYVAIADKTHGKEALILSIKKGCSII